MIWEMRLTDKCSHCSSLLQRYGASVFNAAFHNKRTRQVGLMEVVIPLCVHCRSHWQNYSKSSHSTLDRRVKKSPDLTQNLHLWGIRLCSQAAAKLSSPSGRSGEFIGREIKCSNLPPDNTVSR